MITNRLELCFRSDLFQLKKALDDTINFFKENIPDLPREDFMELKLIYSELLRNAMVHGNGMDPTKQVHLSAEIASNNIYSSVADEGSGFDYSIYLSNLQAKQDLYSETGRGIQLVLGLTDSVSFNKAGNQITFYKRVKGWKETRKKSKWI